MGAHVVILGAALLASPPDTLPVYADSATARLVARAIERHAAQDTTVSDYRAQLRYRVSFGLGRSRWELVPTAAVEEQQINVAWQRPNDLQVEVIGRRARSRSEGIDLSSIFDRPWFIPRGVGDSIRVFGTDFPERGALHPLSAEGPDWYRYAIVDSLGVTDPEGRQLNLVALRVLPRRSGLALIAGKLWLDRATAEVVRLSFRYVGTALWSVPESATHSDSVDARQENSVINRILTLDADLEYGLQDGKYWMPYRQVVSGQIVIPFFGDFVVPFEASTSFDDYVINSRQPIVFRIPLPDSLQDSVSARARKDSIAAEHRRRAEEGKSGEDRESRDYAGRWANGRYEIHRPSNDSLARYTEWGDSLVMDSDPAAARRVREVQEDLARTVDGLPTELSGVPRGGINYQTLADFFRYNRVQGPSLGLGYRYRIKGSAFWSLRGLIRYGFSDQRVLAGLDAVYDAPGGRWTFSGYRDVREVDPFSRGLSFGNTLNGVFAAHDDADYYLAQGGSVAFDRSLSRGLNLNLSAKMEDASSVATQSHSGVNDFLGGSGDFPANTSIQEGTFGILGARLDGRVGRSRWLIGAEGWLGQNPASGRAFGEWVQPIGRGGKDLMLSLKAGITSAPGLPQTDFRAGGRRSVRGFDYGYQRGQAMWALQADWAPIGSWIRPVLFADAGQAAAADQLAQTEILVGGGAGVSLVHGLIRIDFSHAINPGVGGLRVDVAVLAPR
ncbi:MAG TPA: DUF5686 family protein [Gemmatimonadales bacterium]|nr:DUF5686 family protein [Gemmatimonadales bacterium]